ncbi:MAG: integrin [Gammaproteobacteria bacterium]|nr:integrin [Gammaproteobacteria bacterium]
MHDHTRHPRYQGASALLLSLMLALTACGGGGGGSGTTTPPPPPPPPPLSSNADLATLSVPNVVVQPTVFNPQTTTYTALVPNSTTSITINASVADSGATLSVSGDPDNLLVGTNTITVTVTAADGTTKDYTLFVDRLAAVDEISYLKSIAPDANYLFGWSVSVSQDGQYVAVGTPFEDSAATGIDGDATDNNAEAAGAVYVYARNGGTWTEDAYIKASNAESGDGFGFDVALAADGMTLAIGAPAEDSAATTINGDASDNSLISAGAVYIFNRDSANSPWSQVAYIKPPVPGTGDSFGTSVALSDDGQRLVVGATGEDSSATGVDGDATDNSAIDSGAAYVFDGDNNNVWTYTAYLKASNTDPGDNFGSAVSAAGNGNTVAVAATDEASSATGVNGDGSDNSMAGAGAVYIFIDNNAWTQTAYIKASNTGAEDSFGSDIALAVGSATLIIGAQDEDSNATGANGDAQNDDLSASGAAYVFTSDLGGIWTQQAYLKASNAGGGDAFGISVAIASTGDTAIVGAYQEDSSAVGLGGDEGDSGAVASGAGYLFVRDGSGNWSQDAYLKATNTGASDQLGYSVAAASFGNTFVLAAINEDSSAAGVGGDSSDDSTTDAGAVFVYQRGD